MFGITTWKASDALPPWAVGSVSRSTIFICSIERARPSVTDDERQRVLVLGANVDKVDVEPVDLGDELRDGVQLGLAPAPVVLGHPVARDRLDRRQLHALRRVVDALLLGPARGRDARAQILEVPLRDLDRERPDGGLVRCPVDRGSHVVLLGGDGWFGDAADPVPLVCPSHPCKALGSVPGVRAGLMRRKPRSTRDFGAKRIGSRRLETGCSPACADHESERSATICSRACERARVGRSFFGARRGSARQRCSSISPLQQPRRSRGPISPTRARPDPAVSRWLQPARHDPGCLYSSARAGHPNRGSLRPHRAASCMSDMTPPRSRKPPERTRAGGPGRRPAAAS